MKLDRNIQQKQAFKAFIPNPFPPQGGFNLSVKLIQKANTATLKIGKLDGITQLLPDVDFFLFMYIRKDAASSSQIEGTRATMIDAIEAESQTSGANAHYFVFAFIWFIRITHSLFVMVFQKTSKNLLSKTRWIQRRWTGRMVGIFLGWCN